MNLAFPLIALVGMTSVQPDELEKVSLPVIPGLERADLYILKFTEHPAAILVLCPGFDANGENWIPLRRRTISTSLPCHLRRTENC